MYSCRCSCRCTVHTSLDVSERVNHNTFTAIDLDDLGGTIGRAAMIDEPRNSTPLRRINDRILINSEQITAANPTLEISSFSHIGNLLPNLFTNILDNHVIGRDILLGVQAPVMDSRARESNRLLPFLKLVEAKNIALTTGRGKRLLLSINVGNEAAVVDAG